MIGAEGRRRLVMSAQFWPCPECFRHVKRGDAACPFCGATASADAGPKRVLVGRLSRASLFAAGAMGVGVATTDCGTPPLSSAYYGAAVIPLEDSSASDALSEAAPDATDASATTEPTDSSSAADVPMAVPFYGAAVRPDE